MFKYQLHKLSGGRKEARAVLLEDILTSDVFGLMAYLPYAYMLKPFLSRVVPMNLGSTFQVPSNAPTRFEFWPGYSWPAELPRLNRDFIEPDAVIEWNNSLVFVEAKFVSATDPEELLREYLIAHHAAGEKKCVGLLVIDRNLSQPEVFLPENRSKVSIKSYLRRRMRDLGLSGGKSYETVDTSILWCNWQSFYKLAAEKLSDISASEHETGKTLITNLLRDILQVMERKGLMPFEPLDIGVFETWAIDVDRLGYLGRMINRSLIDFSDMHIDVRSLEAIEFLNH
jgi:hypothetical protein